MFVVVILECLIWIEVFFKVIFGLFIVIVVFDMWIGKLNFGVWKCKWLNLIIFLGIYRELFSLLVFILMFVIFIVMWVFVVLKKSELVWSEKLIVGFVIFIFWGFSVVCVFVWVLYNFIELFIEVWSLLIFILYCKEIMWLVFCGLVEEILVINCLMLEERKWFFNISLWIFICVCKVLLLWKWKVVLFRKLKFLVVFFNLKFFNLSLFFNFMCLIFCFFKVERWYFIFIFVFSFFVIVMFFCNGKVLVSVFRLIVDWVWKVINGLFSKLFIFVLVKILVCVFLKWNIFRFRYEGWWCIKLIYVLKFVVILLILYGKFLYCVEVFLILILSEMVGNFLLLYIFFILLLMVILFLVEILLFFIYDFGIICNIVFIEGVCKLYFRFILIVFVMVFCWKVLFIFSWILFILSFVFFSF